MLEEEDEDGNPSTPNFIQYAGSEYYHRDHLGSVIAISYDQGVVQETKLLSFDAWGKRRNENWSEGGIDPVDQYTPEGMRGNLAYTGHEAVPEVGLIHMNGRVYDPELGVFLSADPEIQSPTSSQNYNRYSYVLNNPIRYTDPSGFNFLEKISPNLATVISVALTAVGCVSCSVAFNMAYANANGAGPGQTIMGGFVGALSGQIGGQMMGIKPNVIPTLAQSVGAGMIGGALTGGFNAYVAGDNFFRGAAQGAIYGAATAFIMHNIKYSNESMQPAGVIEEVVESDIGGEGEIDPDINKMISKYFKGDSKYKHLFTMDDAGNITLSASVSSDDSALLGDMISDVNSKYDHVAIDGKTFTIRLQPAEGAGDFHLISRDQALANNRLSNPDRCETACRLGGTNTIVAKGTSINGGQYAHEIFHALGWASGNNHIPSRTDIMFEAFKGRGHGLKAHHYWGTRNFFIGK